MNLLGPMLHPITGKMLHDLLSESDYSSVVFTRELIKLLVYHRIKKIYERKIV